MRSRLIASAALLSVSSALLLRPQAPVRPPSLSSARRCASLRCQAADDAAATLLAVTVPEGMQGGMMLQVQTPAGLMQVQIPDGLGPGSTFQMQVPAAAPAAVPAPAPEVQLPPPVPPAASSASDDYLSGQFAEDWAAAGRKDALAADVARFKAQAAVDNPGEDGEDTLLQKTINTLGTVLTYNFFIIISFFVWFVAGVGAQFGLKDFTIIDGFKGCWGWLIQPLLTTHMTLTFLSAGLEKLSGNEKEA